MWRTTTTIHIPIRIYKYLVEKKEESTSAYLTSLCITLLTRNMYTVHNTYATLHPTAFTSTNIRSLLSFSAAYLLLNNL